MKQIGIHGAMPDKPELLEHEFQELLGALRRDRQREETAAELHPEEFWHGYRVRMDVRLLEVLNPKACVFMCGVEFKTLDSVSNAESTLSTGTA